MGILIEPNKVPKRTQLKGLVHPKVKILLLITHPHVVPNL